MPIFPARILLTALLAAGLLAASPAAHAGAPLRVLFVGNSMTYVNDLPRLLRAFAASQPGGTTIVTSAWVAPGGSIDERWRDGHAAQALRTGDWDVVVLQERSKLIACLSGASMPRERECRASDGAHRKFAALAAEHGTRVLLLSTWAGDADGQAALDRGMHNLADRLTGEVAIVPTGAILRQWADRQPADAPAFPDGGHPSFSASLIVAAILYQSITGNTPVAGELVVDFPLLVPRSPISASKPLEAHADLPAHGQPFRLAADAVAPFLEVAAARD